MTPKQRFLAALRNQVPDRVPAAPDISNYIPAKRTGLPFWDLYFYQKFPHWRAYLDAIDDIGGEAWLASCWGPDIRHEDDGRTESSRHDEYRADMDAIVRTSTTRTPDGDLCTRRICFRADPPTAVVKPIQDLSRDWKKYRWTQHFPVSIDPVSAAEPRAECERREQAFGLRLGYPGFHAWQSAVQGGIEALAYASVDAPEILDEWAEFDLEYNTRLMRLYLAMDSKPDYILLGGSGTLTMSSPELVRKYCLPTVKRLTRMAKEADVPTMLHACGKSKAWVKMLAEETDLNSINPLEVPPMGDADLAELKSRHGQKISLMGNLHTTQVMLMGAPADVRRASLEAMRDAASGGGFVLSTGDQCGRETPPENLLALINTAKEFGVYDQKTGRLPRVGEALRTVKP